MVLGFKDGIEDLGAFLSDCGVFDVSVDGFFKGQRSRLYLY